MKLEGKDKIKIYTDLLPYVVPKLNTTILKPDIDVQKKTTFELFPLLESD